MSGSASCVEGDDFGEVGGVEGSVEEGQGVGDRGVEVDTDAYGSELERSGESS